MPRWIATISALIFASAPVDAAAEPSVRVRWLGVAGFSVQAEDTVLLFDPYFSRPGLVRTLLTRYRPDAAVLGRLLRPDSPAPELASAALILIGQSHFHHLGDAPWIAQQTGAAVLGSSTTVAISWGYGVATNQTRRANPGATVHEGPFEIRVVESRHAEVMFGRVPLPGEVDRPPPGPIHALSFKLGDARGYLVTHRPTGLRIYVLSSANRDLPALQALAREGVEVDLLLSAITGRDAEYARDLIETLRPRLVIPHHFDSFFRSLDDPEAAAPSDPEDLAAFESEVRTAASVSGRSVAVRRLGLFEALELSPAN